MSNLAKEVQALVDKLETARKRITELEKKADVKSGLVKVKELEGGDCFRREKGKRVYLVLSESARQQMSLTPRAMHGVCYKGNYAMLYPDDKVVRMPLSAMEINRKEDTPTYCDGRGYPHCLCDRCCA